MNTHDGVEGKEVESRRLEQKNLSCPTRTRPNFKEPDGPGARSGSSANFPPAVIPATVTAGLVPYTDHTCASLAQFHVWHISKRVAYLHGENPEFLRGEPFHLIGQNLRFLQDGKLCIRSAVSTTQSREN